MDYTGTNQADVIDESVQALPQYSVIYGAAGDDTITASTATMLGDAGNDRIVATGTTARAAYWDSPAGINVNLATGIAADGWGTTDTLVNVRQVVDSGFSDTLVGSAADETFWLSGGSDTVTGGGGSDTVIFYNMKSTDVTLGYDQGTDTFTVRKHLPNGDTGTDVLRGINEIQFIRPDSDSSSFTRDMFATMNGFVRLPGLVPVGVPGVDQMRVGDFNGDGKLDVLVTRITGDAGITSSPLEVLLGDGHGGLTDGTAQVFAAGVPYVHYVPRIFVGDFNRDGVTDIFCPDFGVDAPPFPGGQNSMFLSGSNKQLVNVTSWLPQALLQNHAASIGDVNNDGFPDLVLDDLNSKPGVPADKLFINDGTGFLVDQSAQRLPLSVQQETAGHTYSMIGDLNGDGWADIVLGTWDPNPLSSQVLLNDGHGSFANATPIALPASGIDKPIVLEIERIDLNGDSLPDLVLSITNGGDRGLFYQTPYLQLLVNDGGGHFHDETQARLPQQIPTPSASATSAPWFKVVTPIDLNGDGHADLVVDGENIAPRVYMNDGTGHFTETWEGAQNQHVTVGDFDGDGAPDLVVSDWTGFYILSNKTATTQAMTNTGMEDHFVGGTGRDYVHYSGKASAYQVRHLDDGDFTVTDKSSGVVDTLHSIERIQFADGYEALDVSGTGGQAYRLYQAAFGRVPDVGGLGYQIHDLDTWLSLPQVAANFIASPEFQSTYGQVSDRQFITLLYQNVLHRAPDDGGLQFHLDELASGQTRADVLTHFSESPENKANVIGAIDDGMFYTL